jgi:hypothetical protein
MFKRLMIAGAVLCAALVPGMAKNMAVPTNDPIATLTIPDTWDMEQIDYGYSAEAPDGTVKFYVEYASAARLDKMFATNDEWMEENSIKPKGKAVEKEMELGGLPAKIFTYQATDENGDTIVDFVVMPGGKGRTILLTLWGSQEEREANKADIIAIQSSIKAIN